ncbi:MAG: hypothetical protein GX047_06390 [Firmicutes bacterium]|jgi:N-acetylglucosamine kinase-like BadF-type ATPase|nr:hypothetical protein [Bacillota bacterium]
MGYILGIDGGGSKTTAILADETGKVLGEGRGGASNYQTIGLEKAGKAIGTAAAAAIQAAGEDFSLSLKDLEGRLVVVAGLAGADRPLDRERLWPVIWNQLPLRPAQLRVEHDARVALAAATGNKPGIILIAGTGSIAFGIDDTGREVRAGGWGPILGDEGSGYFIGKAALTAVLWEYDGRGKPTSLTERITSFLGTPRPDEVVPLVYQGPLQRPEIAKLAEIVLEEAVAGDEVSQCLITDAAKHLVKLISAVLARLEWTQQSIPAAGTGGLLRPSNLLWTTISEMLNRSHPQVNFSPPILPPELGAVLLGRESLDTGIPYEEFLLNLGSYIRETF